MQKIISVFGSASPQPGDADYELAYTVGQLLAQAGYGVATGGYIGTMEAVSRGASEAGGHVIGITSNQIEQFRPISANQWIKEEIKYETLRERLMHLVINNDGMIALPGGIGTLAEVSIAWNMMQTGDIEKRPFALLGSLWSDTINAFYDPKYIQEVYMDLITMVDSPETAVAHVTGSENL